MNKDELIKKMTAEEYIDEMNGHNSWQHYPPSKQKVIGWLKQFAEMQVEAINYTHSCESDSEQLLFTQEEIVARINEQTVLDGESFRNYFDKK